MTTQTYKYFQPESGNLRTEYGGAAILDNGDTREVSAASLTVRHITKELGMIASGASQLCEIGVDGSANVWFKVSDNLYPGISSYLTTAELASVVSSAPAGYTSQSTIADLQPLANRTNIIVRGDSISFGLGTTTGDTQDTVWAQAINELDSGTLSFNSDATIGIGKEYALINPSLGSSSWANTGGGGPATYPEREDLAYNQRIKTLALDSGVFVYWLGTNDIDYDGTLSGADCWARAASRIAALAADFPNFKIIVCTPIRRSEASSVNDRLADLRTSMLAGYVAAGAHVACDFESVTEMAISTGNTENTTYYNVDKVHPKTAGQTLLVPVAKTALQTALALL